MAEKDIKLKQVLKRFPPGDRWTPADADQPVFASFNRRYRMGFSIYTRT
jgi:hypothetical protein